MRNALIILVMSIAIYTSAQNPYSPFTGGFEIGIGKSTVIDFNRDNNLKFNAELASQGLRLNPFIPFHIGFVSAKYLGFNQYLEVGLILNKSSYLYPKSGWELSGLNFYSIDLPFKYYFPIGIFKKATNLFLGLIPSWLIKPEAVSVDSYTDIADEHFRKVYLSMCGGLSRNRKNLRFKIHSGLAITSVVKPTYRQQIPADERSYGEVILPFEVLFCCAYLIK